MAPEGSIRLILFLKSWQLEYRNICGLFAAVSRGGREPAVLAPARRVHSVLAGGCRQHGSAASGRADRRREATPRAGLQGCPR